MEMMALICLSLFYVHNILKNFNGKGCQKQVRTWRKKRKIEKNLKSGNMKKITKS